MRRRTSGGDGGRPDRSEEERDHIAREAFERSRKLLAGVKRFSVHDHSPIYAEVARKELLKLDPVSNPVDAATLALLRRVRVPARDVDSDRRPGFGFSPNLRDLRRSRFTTIFTRTVPGTERLQDRIVDSGSDWMDNDNERPCRPRLGEPAVIRGSSYRTPAFRSRASFRALAHTDRYGSGTRGSTGNDPALRTLA